MIKKEKTRQRLLNVLDFAPAIKEIMLSSDTIDLKREKIRRFLSDMLIATFEDNQTIPPLEWVLTRDAINVMKNIVSLRSERLCGYSLLQYIDDLLHRTASKDLKEPNSAFFAELGNLLKGVMGKTGIYPDKIPSFVRHEGTKAARLRSADLSRMAEASKNFLERYPSGLDNDVIRRRSYNKQRILKYFGATELEWGKWRWHVRHIIRTAETLKNLIKLNDQEYEAVRLAREYGVPFGITPY